METMSKEEKKRAYMRQWRSANKERIAAYNKEYAQNNYAVIKSNRTVRNKANKEKIALVTKAWKDKNKEKIKAYNKDYTSERYKNDPIYKLKINQRTRTRAILKSGKTAKTHELLGCSFEELKIHIESQFIDDMGWHNMGEWHIDHIIPLAAFDLTVEANQRLAFNYKNLQPLWAIDNLKKGAKYG